jgi:predicted phage terminase large subunit-like protein
LQLSIQEKWEKLAREDYSFYCEYTHNGMYTPAKHHLLISGALERIERGELKRLMIFMPPRHGKSQTVSETFPSWYIGRNPRRRVIAVSYGDTLSRQFGRKNRAKLLEFGKGVFDIELAKDNNQTNNFSIEGEPGGALFTGIGGAVTGMGCSCLIIDDPIKNRLEANSKTYRDRVWDEYQNSLLTRLTSDGAVIIINTRWHEDDLCGRILKKEPEKWEIIKLPAAAEEKDALGRSEGAPLWPEFGFDSVWLEETKKAVGSQTWNALYQQRPSAQEGNIIKRNWFHFYKQAPAEFDEQLISVDATFKDKEDSDFCVLQVWQKTGANKYLLDQVRARMGFTATIQAIRTLSAKFPRATAKLIEDKANGSAIIDFLKHEISGIIPVEPAGGKVSRAYAVQPQIEAGNVYLPEGAAWIHDFIEECANFPQGANDDQVDCMTQALNRFQQPSGFFIGRA